MLAGITADDLEKISVDYDYQDQALNNYITESNYDSSDLENLKKQLLKTL